jgi:hypothetical protein
MKLTETVEAYGDVSTWDVLDKYPRLEDLIVASIRYMQGAWYRWGRVMKICQWGCADDELAKHANQIFPQWKYESMQLKSENRKAVRPFRVKVVPGPARPLPALFWVNLCRDPISATHENVSLSLLTRCYIRCSWYCVNLMPQTWNAFISATSWDLTVVDGRTDTLYSVDYYC